MSDSSGNSRGKVSTGFERLDKALQGGFLESSAILLAAPAGDEVPVILRKFLEAATDAKSLIICGSLSSAQAIAPLDTSNLKFLVFSGVGQREAFPNVFQSGGLDNLTELNLDISEVFKSFSPERVGIYVLSDILLRHRALVTRRWLTEVLGRFRSRHIITLAIVNPKLHPREEIEALKELFDGNIEICESDNAGRRGNILRINWMHGIEVVEKELPLDLLFEKPIHRPPAARIHNLPIELTSLVGREKELSEAKGLLMRDDVRLVTLTGPGGTGKTRLGLEVARDFLDRFADGVFLVSLAQIADPTLLMPTIAHTLSIIEEGGRPIIDTLKDHLRDKQMLILLDNFEQLVKSATQVANLLTSCPKLKAIVTSREALHIRGEFEFSVPPLALPDLKTLWTVEELRQNAAVSLFLQRALAVKSDFELTKENARAVGEICVRLDGLPLALELAAARVKLFSPQAISERLRGSLKILTGGPRDLPERQQTLRGAIDWSYELLNQAEKILFRKLSVFFGGCTLETAEAVCSRIGEQDIEILDGISSLVDKNLLRREEHEGEARFAMLETIREFALEALVESGEDAEVRRRHANLFLALAEQGEPELLGPRQAEWLRRLEQEHGNLREALQWSVTRGDSMLSLHLAAALWRFWYTRGYLIEGRTWLSKVLAQSSEESVVRAEILNGAGALAHAQGDFSGARVLYEESLTIFNKLSDKRGIAACLNNLGLIANDQGDFVRARNVYEESLTISRELGDQTATAHLLNNLALMDQQRGEYSQSRSLFEESLVIKRQLGDERGVAATLLNLGNLSRDVGDFDRANSLYEESLTMFKRLGEKRGIAYSLNNSGLVASAQSNYAHAEALFEQSLPLFKELGDKLGLAVCLQGMAGLAHAKNDYELASKLYNDSLALRNEIGDKEGIAEALEGLAGIAGAKGKATIAARLLGAAEALREKISAPLPPADRIGHDRNLEATRTELGDEVFSAAWMEGRKMKLEDVISQVTGTRDGLWR